MQRARGRGDAGLTPVGEIAGRLPAAPGAVGLVVARAAWRLVAGRELARRLPLVEVAGDTWRLALPGPAWAAELPRLQAELLPRLQRLPAGAGVLRLAGATMKAEPAAAEGRAPREAGGAAPAEAGTARQRLEALARRLLARPRPETRP